MIVFATSALKDVAADSLAFWMADFTEVSVAEIHANAVDAFQLS